MEDKCTQANSFPRDTSGHLESCDRHGDMPRMAHLWKDSLLHPQGLQLAGVQMLAFLWWPWWQRVTQWKTMLDGSNDRGRQGSAPAGQPQLTTPVFASVCYHFTMYYYCCCYCYYFGAELYLQIVADSLKWFLPSLCFTLCYYSCSLLMGSTNVVRLAQIPPLTLNFLCPFQLLFFLFHSIDSERTEYVTIP